jgi:hypothetical protein
MTPDDSMELVEIVARGICRLKIAHNLERDGKPRGAAWRRTMEDAGWQYWTAEAAAALAAIESSGRRIVPVEPTEAQLNAARDWAVAKYGQGVGNDGASGCYRAMLSASPKVTT